MLQRLRGQTVLNITHWGNADGLGSDFSDIQVQNFLTELSDRWTLLQTMLHETWEFLQARVRAINGRVVPTPPDGTGDVTYGFDFAIDHIPPILGNQTTDPLPTYASSRCIKRTNLTGRNWRGAMRVAGWVEAWTEGDAFDAANLILIQAWHDQFFFPVSVAPMEAVFLPRVFSRSVYLIADPEVTPHFASALQVSQPVSPYLGTQNTRKRSATGL